MDARHARAQFLALLYEKDKAKVAAFLRKHRDILPPESFDDLASFFEGKLRHRAGRKHTATLSLAREYGRLRVAASRKSDAKIEASKLAGLEAQEGRTLAGHMRLAWFRKAVECEEALCRAWAETTEKIEAGGPEASREWIENCLRAYVTRAREIDPDQLHYTWLTLPSGECITITD
ncbi:hypothetical protein M7784_04135 [Desulfovibrio aminophilus]|nr:hypothetical protein [Desulfovibrio aminophilus]MCM0754432.1 hypothetical protein [Desulfovibrio aminophilus]